jgi:hypothetical protein
MKSKLYRINWKDLGRGVLIAFATAFFTALAAALAQGGVSFTWAYFNPIVMAGVSALIAYLLKNFSTNSKDKFLKKEDGLHG